jgi:arylsulfatase A-like enzyme
MIAERPQRPPAHGRPDAHAALVPPGHVLPRVRAPAPRGPVLRGQHDLEVVGLAPCGFEAWQGPDDEGFPYQGLTEDGGFADRAIAWLEAHARGGPWLLTCSFINPHDIMFYSRVPPPDDLPARCEALPDNFTDDLATKPRVHAQYQRFWDTVMGMTPEQPDDLWRRYGDYYLWLTEKVDAEIGRVLDALEASGVADRTLTVFLSDHGETAGPHTLQGNGPFVYHENVQVPLILRWPGRVAGGAVTNSLANNVDVFPTLLDLAGAGPAPPHLPGHSLATVVRGAHDAAVHEEVLLSWGMTMRRARGIPGAPRPTAATAPDVTPAPGEVRGMFDGRFKFARYFDETLPEQEYELHDLRNDPHELRNLAADPAWARSTREMAERLAAAEARDMAPRGIDGLGRVGAAVGTTRRSP